VENNMAANPAAAPAPDVTPATVLDAARGLMWTAQPLACGRVSNRSGGAAETACTECRVGGFDDWRLPTVDELQTLIDRTRFNPAIDTDKFPDTPSNWFWSSSPDASDPDYAWLVAFYLGHVHLLRRGNGAFVRAVRSVPASQ
jgi:hypothetical protein